MPERQMSSLAKAQSLLDYLTDWRDDLKKQRPMTALDVHGKTNALSVVEAHIVATEARIVLLRRKTPHA